MGRGRLRRGCSLEVIFEEDPDFCSHLDSLDGGVAIRFGIKEPDDAISLDSLLEVEEYQVRFEDPADAEQVFRSLDGFIDVRNMDSCMVEWDEFSMDSHSLDRLAEEDPGNGTTGDSLLDDGKLAAGATSNTDSEKAPNSGRRSRVSRRQIIQASWLGYSSSSDESLANPDPDDIDNNNNSNTTRARNRPHKAKPGSNKEEPSSSSPTDQKSDNDGSTLEPTSITSTASASSVKAISIVSGSGPSSGGVTVTGPNLVTSLEDCDRSREGAGGGDGSRLRTPIQIQLRASPNSNAPPHAIFGRATDPVVDFLEKDTLDSYISTMTDETDANAYTFADPFDDTHSVASTNYESSGSTSSTESNGSSVCTVNSFSVQNNGRSKSSGGNEGKTGSGNSAGFSSISGGNGNSSSSSGGGGSSSKYKTNLKVELVSQLNKSHEAAAAAASLQQRMTGVGAVGSSSPPQLGVTAPGPASVMMNPAGGCHLYSANSSPDQSPSLKPSAHHQPMVNNHHQPTSLSGGGSQQQQPFSGEVKRVRALFELRNHSRSSPNGSGRSGSSSNGSTCPSSPESTSRSISSRNGGKTTAATTTTTIAIPQAGGSGDTSPSGRVGLYSKNGRRSRGSPPMLSQGSAASPSKVLRSNYSNGNSNNTSPTQDLGDLLVNQNVVIEDSPDIYQTSRSRRNGNYDRDSVPSPPITNKRPITIMHLSPGNGLPTPASCSASASAAASPSSGSLRRSQSMGTGISSLGSPSAYTGGILKQSTSKTNILAEELPAPDTVKNVRNVFENMLKMRGKNNHNHGSESSVDTVANNVITPGSFSGSFSIVKKSLSYIKSNPTSKIYRSESMRDDFPSMGRRFGKPVLLSENNSPVHSPSHSTTWLAGPTPASSSPTLQSVAEAVSRCAQGSDVVDGPRPTPASTRARRSNSTSPTNKTQLDRAKISERAKFSPKINTGLSPSSVPGMLRSSCQVPLTEEDPSFSCNIASAAAIEEDYRTRKYVQSDVLQKIRSAGTTTTYFGGKIVGKTVKNRKIPVSRRHTFDFQDYVGISGEVTTHSNYLSYNPSTYYDGEGELEQIKCSVNTSTSGSGSTSNTCYARRDSYRPALDIPLKGTSSSFVSQNTTISGALDSIFAGGVGAGLLTFASKPIDTTPRIISVLHKSPPGSQSSSPVKSCSPVGSVIEEGRNSPEGCEASPNEKTLEEQAITICQGRWTPAVLDPVLALVGRRVKLLTKNSPKLLKELGSNRSSSQPPTPPS